LLERIDARSSPWLEAVRAAAAQDYSFALITEATENALAKRVQIDKDPGTAGIPAGPLQHQRLPKEGAGRDAGGPRARAPGVVILDSTGRRMVGTKPVHDEALTIIEKFSPSLHDLVMFGGGHVGQAVARIVATLPFRVTWFDSRKELTGTCPSNDLSVQLRDDPVASVKDLPAGALYLVFTHSHDLDYKLVRAILARGDFRYCGLIGSATKRARFESRLIRDGISAPDIARLTCPIGAIGLTSKAPEILAVGIAAELLLAIQNQPETQVSIQAQLARATHD
jgi:xanthine dehydrogenase accessory factor